MTVSAPIRPILVCMVWRGGARFARCLKSIATSRSHFERVIISVTGAPHSHDMQLASTFQAEHPNIEVICTQQEMPTMEHQAFWIDYLIRTGAKPTDWIYWLAYDDEVRARGVEAIVDSSGNWPLEDDTVYFGPWAMRHEQPDELWTGDSSQPLESWTSFPQDGPKRLPVMQWIADQVAQPTYMQMSGSVCPFGNFIELNEGKPTKRGPMRIEMATAASGDTKYVQEFSEPISIIYGRANSDRASYGRQARREDAHLLAWLARYTAHNPRASAQLTHIASTVLSQQVRLRTRKVPLPSEEWRVRGICTP